jgi:ubiquinone/menaquinone biosynthesis C-methylase UbiE
MDSHRPSRPSPYHDPSTALRYNGARDLPESSRRFWIDLIRSSVAQTPADIVDVGCGTGRFTALLHEAFGCSIIGVDPSAAMLEQAREVHGDIVEWRQGTAENLGIESASVDMIFMSQAYHHLPSVADAMLELRRVSRPDARLMIRNGTRENLEEFGWLSHFPSALELERRRAPTRREIVWQAEDAGYHLVSLSTIELPSADSWTEHLEKIRRRGLSALLMIDDAEFEAGCQELERWIEESSASEPANEPVDFLVFDLE